jgi:hypothetical protein
MYFWKCWRDTRSFFIVFLIIAAIVMPVAAVVCVGTGLLENFGSEAFRSTFEIITLFAALALGALGASEQFAGSTVHFLFTKPRSRAYFVWTGWVVGCAQLLAIDIVNLAAGALTLSHYNKNPFHSVMSGSVTASQLAGALIFGLYVYCVTACGAWARAWPSYLACRFLRLPFAGDGKSTSPSQLCRLNACRRSLATSSGCLSRYFSFLPRNSSSNELKYN